MAPVVLGNRLVLDAHVLGYWGFDEANETDQALDESQYSRHLNVTAATAVLPARVNNGRQFNGSSTVCTATDSSFFRLTGDLTIIVWPTLDQVNTSGSRLRCILECGGASGAQSDNILFALYVSDDGRLIYRHEHSAGLLVEYRTAAGTIRTGRYYSVALTRDASAICLFIDNKSCAWESATVDGVSHNVSSPAPFPDGGTSATFKVGSSSKASDSAWWQGTIDELSVHDVARPNQPYLRSVYFKLTLSTVFYRLTTYNNVKSVATSEMGGGSRWWLYERDQSIYAIRENTLGLFSQEVQLTTGGLQPNGTIAPGGAEKPTVFYDKSNDLLVVAFIAGGKVFKLTAASGDAPITQSMPYTVDTAGIVKVRDSNEGIRLGVGVGHDRTLLAYTYRTPIKQYVTEDGPLGIGSGPDLREKGYINYWGTAVNSSTVNPTTYGVMFTMWPSFGLFIPWANSRGFAVYAELNGVEFFLGKVTTTTTDALGRTFGFFPIPSRRLFLRYYVKPLNDRGDPVAVLSNVVEDLLATANVYDWRAPNSHVYNRNDDDPHGVPLGIGSGLGKMLPIYTTRTPIKFSGGNVVALGTGGQLRSSISTSGGITAPQRRPLEVA